MWWSVVVLIALLAGPALATETIVHKGADPMLGCSREDDFERISNLLGEDDVDAALELFLRNALLGRCQVIMPGDRVIVYRHTWGNLAQVRRVGSPDRIYMWPRMVEHMRTGKSRRELD